MSGWFLVYGIMFITCVAFDRWTLQGDCPECQGPCVHRSWWTTMTVAVAWPAMLVWLMSSLLADFFRERP